MYRWILIVFIPGCLSASFSYIENDLYGPSHWKEHYPECGGQRQSPINIQTADTTKIKLPPLRLEPFSVSQGPSTIKNTGYTVKFHPKELLRVSGGPLTGRYILEQFHFHWGRDNTVGSESTVDGRSYAAELHMVFFKEDYGSFAQSLPHEDGLTVLSVFIDAGNQKNENYASLIESLQNVRAPQSSTNVHLQNLIGYLPSSLHSYFTWFGSLTTPPCSEIVTWIQFEEPVILSNEQLEAFRAVELTAGDALTGNYRKPQSLNGRTVFHNTL